VVIESLGKGQGDVMERLIMKGEGEGKQLHKKDQA
jgi:hypothetical protein